MGTIKVELDILRNWFGKELHKPDSRMHKAEMEAIMVLLIIIQQGIIWVNLEEMCLNLDLKMRGNINSNIFVIFYFLLFF